MHVERGFQVVVVKPFQKARRIRENALIPGIGPPAVAVFRIRIGDVPVHIDDRHGKRDAAGSEVFHQFAVAFLGIAVIAAPPVAERPARDHRFVPGDRAELLQSNPDVGGISEIIQILPVAGKRFKPAVFVQNHRIGIVEHDESDAVDHAVLELAGAVNVVEGGNGAAEVGRFEAKHRLRLFKAPFVAFMLGICLQKDGKSLLGEGFFIIFQNEAIRFDLEAVFALPHLKLRHGETPAERQLRRTVLKNAVRAVFHPDHTLVKHGKAVAVPPDDGAGIGDRRKVEHGRIEANGF